MTRVLLIDDDANVAAAIRAILERQAFQIEHASRAHAGIHALQQSKFDVVIVDIFMPGMGGLDTIKSIRQRAPGMPIVAMTGFRLRPSKDPDMDFLMLAIQRGATSCVRKPFAPAQLLEAIDKSLARSPLSDEMSQCY
jgi:DNA-binding NtrC family response regulator